MSSLIESNMLSSSKLIVFIFLTLVGALRGALDRLPVAQHHVAR
jgi:hypothetical protein